MYRRSVVLVLGIVALLLLQLDCALAVSVPVGNFSFESPAVPVTSTPPNSPPLWSAGAGGGGGAGTYTAGSPVFPNQDGSRLGYVFVRDQPGSYGALYQDAVKIQEGTYEMTVGVGHEPGLDPTTAPLFLNFEAVGIGGPKVLLSENAFSPDSTNGTTLTDLTVSVTIPSDSPEIGRYLRPVIVAVGPDGGINPNDPRATYNVDNVRLTLTPPGGSPQPVPVGDNSFEYISTGPWHPGYGTGGSAGLFRPAAPRFSNQVGDQLGFVTLRQEPEYAVLYQDVTTIGAGTYTMTVGIGADGDYPPTQMPLLVFFESIAPNYKATLGSQLVVTPIDVNSTSLTDKMVSVSIPQGSADIGRTLRLVLVAVAGDPGSNPSDPDPRATYLFDNVRLDFQPLPTITGDYNSDGIVDAADYAVWRKNTGTSNTLPNDPLGGTIGPGQYDQWKANFGQSVGAAGTAATIPEPGSMVLWLAGVLGLGAVGSRPANRDVSSRGAR